LTLNRRSTLALALIFAILGLLPQALSRTLPDIAFPLWAAERMQHGARLYVDILEINPPLFIWLDLPLVWLSRVTGLGSITWYRIATSLLLFASLAGCWWALKRGLGGEEVEEVKFRRVLWLAAAFALLLLPRLDWGEREHLSLALTLPYILLGIARARGRAVPTGGAVLAGIAAGIGIAFKPYFVLVWVGREVASRGSRVASHESPVTGPATRDPRPETIAVPLLCIAYLISVMVIHPEYFHLVRELGSAYRKYLRNGILITLLFGEGSAIVLGALVVALALREIPKHAAVWRVLIGTTLASFVAAVLQAKGWRYHFYPALGLSMLLFAAMAWDSRRLSAVAAMKVGRAGATLMRPFAAMPSAALATAILLSAALAVRQIVEPHDPRYDADPSLAQLIPIVRDRAAGRPVFVFSPNMASGFPLTNYAGTVWPSRLSNMWPAAVAYDSATRGLDSIRFRALDAMTPIERFALETTVDDFLSSRAVMVLALIAVDQPGWDMQRLNMVAFLKRDPRFAKRWANYDPAGRVGNYAVFRLHGEAWTIPPEDFRTAAVQSAPPASIQVSGVGLLGAAVFLGLLALIIRSSRSTGSFE
jgi:hypothetical protein